MRLISKKCMVCGHWHHGSRGHCDVCGSCHLTNNIHIDIVTNRMIASGMKMMPYAKRNMLAIAQELSK